MPQKKDLASWSDPPRGDLGHGLSQALNALQILGSVDNSEIGKSLLPESNREEHSQADLAEYNEALG